MLPLISFPGGVAATTTTTTRSVSCRPSKLFQQRLRLRLLAGAQTQPKASEESGKIHTDFYVIYSDGNGNGNGINGSNPGPSERAEEETL